MHPEACPDPAVLRWVLPPGTLAVRGEVAHAPGVFGDLLAAGVLSAVAGPAGLLVRLHGELTWRVDGPRVRTALAQSLSEPGWRAVGEAGAAAETHPDALLREVAQEVIDGDAGGYVRSHGGTIDLVDVRQGCVEVRLGGACGSCPAVRGTLTGRVESALRAAYPDLVALRRV